VNNFGDKVSFIWSVTDLLRAPYRPNQYKDVMLPMTVLRRLDCVLEQTKDQFLAKLEKFKGDPKNLAANLTHYIKGFSDRARELIEHFAFEEQIAKLDKADRIFLLVSKFCEINLHPDRISNIDMGTIFEELIRRFNEASNEDAGDHSTPRAVIRLMVNLHFLPDSRTLTTKGIVKTLYGLACGIGGMLSVAEEYVRELNPDARLTVFAQAYAICGSDMMIKGHNIDHIRFRNSFTDDHLAGKPIDYMLANPPFGVKWEAQQDFVKREHEEQGFGGRFGAVLPRLNGGSLLFLLHMIAKMKDERDGGTRLAIAFNGSPLFTGGAGSGESEIRRWIIENDGLEAIVALPDQLFYNTGIHTYLWIVTNRKTRARRGKVQLINAAGFFKKMRESLGNKRHEVCEEQRNEITRLYGELTDGEHVRIFAGEDFGFRRITVERPLRLNFVVTEERLAALQADAAFQKLATSKIRKDKKAVESDPTLWDYENVPLGEDVDAYMQREVLPHVPEAGWTSRRPRWATRSASTAISTSTLLRARLTRSKATSSESKRRLPTCSRR